MRKRGLWHRLDRPESAIINWMDLGAEYVKQIFSYKFSRLVLQIRYSAYAFSMKMGRWSNNCTFEHLLLE